MIKIRMRYKNYYEIHVFDTKDDAIEFVGNDPDVLSWEII